MINLLIQKEASTELFIVINERLKLDYFYSITNISLPVSFIQLNFFYLFNQISLDHAIREAQLIERGRTTDCCCY